MELIEQLTIDIKEAMKAKQKERLDVLRMLKAKLIENKTSAKPQSELDVAISHHKKLKDSLESFPEGNEIRLKTQNELQYLEPYLPKQVSENDVKAIIQTIVANLPAANFGAVMKELSPQIKGKFDGKRASDLVKEILS